MQSRLGQSDVGHAKGPPLAFPMFYLLASSVDSRHVCPSPSIRVDGQLCISHQLITVYCCTIHLDLMQGIDTALPLRTNDTH